MDRSQHNFADKRGLDAASGNGKTNLAGAGLANQHGMSCWAMKPLPTR